MFGWNDVAIGTKYGSNKIVIYANRDGNVGINTTAPAYNLDVTGSTRVTNKLYVGTTTPSIYSTLEIDNATDFTSFKMKSTGTGAGYMTFSPNGLYDNFNYGYIKS